MNAFLHKLNKFDQKTAMFTNVSLAIISLALCAESLMNSYNFQKNYLTNETASFPIVSAYTPTQHEGNFLDRIREYNQLNEASKRMGGSVGDLGQHVIESHDVEAQSTKKVLGLANNIKDNKLKAMAINGYVNTIVDYNHDKVDSPLWYRLTHDDNWWQETSQTLQSKSGVCCDYATLKAAALVHSGYPKEDVFVLTLDSQGVGHAVCAVRDQGELFILDNNSPKPESIRSDNFVEFGFTSASAIFPAENYFNKGSKNTLQYAINMRGKAIKLGQDEGQTRNSSHKGVLTYDSDLNDLLAIDTEDLKKDTERYKSKMTQHAISNSRSPQDSIKDIDEKAKIFFLNGFSGFLEKNLKTNLEANIQRDSGKEADLEKCRNIGQIAQTAYMANNQTASAQSDASPQRPTTTQITTVDTKCVY